MRRIVLIALFLTSTVAAAQVAGPPQPRAMNQPLSFTGDEVDQIVADLSKSGLMVEQPNGALQPFVGNGAQKVLQLISEKENAARMAEAKAKADAAPKPPAPPAPAPAEPPK